MIHNVVLLISIIAVLLLVPALVTMWRRGQRTARTWAVGVPASWLPSMTAIPEYMRMPYDLQERSLEASLAKSFDIFFDGVGQHEQLSEAMEVANLGRAGLLAANLKTPPIQELRFVLGGEESEVREFVAAHPERFPASWLVTAWDLQAQAPRHIRAEENKAIMAAWQSALSSGPERPAQPNYLYYAEWALAYWKEHPELHARMAPLAPELATSAEAFAGASEAFLRVPKSLLSRQPGVYQALRAFYQFDPARWQ
jgi:hypothetical protein